MKYTTLDQNRERIRDWDEINKIEADFQHFKSTGNIEYMKAYETDCTNLMNLITEDIISVRALAVAYWDELHPLSMQDQRIRSRIMRRKIVDAKFLS